MEKTTSFYNIYIYIYIYAAKKVLISENLDEKESPTT